MDNKLKGLKQACNTAAEEDERSGREPWISEDL
jgi:hypothetical protein